VPLGWVTTQLYNQQLYVAAAVVVVVVVVVVVASMLSLQCFNTVGWAAGRASGL